MRYLGGKARIAKAILAAIQPKRDQLWVEPFVGGGWVAVESAKYVDRLLLADRHTELIVLWQALYAGWVPPAHISEAEYQQFKVGGEPHIRAFVGFGCSFGGKFFGGYARGEQRNWAAEASRSLVKKITVIRQCQEVTWYATRYHRLQLPSKPCTIYCDPPYIGTTKYQWPFSHKKFWAWADKQAEAGHAIYVSEYKAPAHWRAAAEFQTKTDMNTANGKEPRLERLWVPK